MAGAAPFYPRSSAAERGLDRGVPDGHLARPAEFLQILMRLSVICRFAVTNGRTVNVEHGQHQEISVSRKLGPGLAQVAIYHDDMDHPAIGGGGVCWKRGRRQVRVEFLEDPSTASFRFIGPAYSANGMNVMVSEPLGEGIVGGGLSTVLAPRCRVAGVAGRKCRFRMLLEA